MCVEPTPESLRASPKFVRKAGSLKPLNGRRFKGLTSEKWFIRLTTSLTHGVQPVASKIASEGFLNEALLNAPVPTNPHDAAVAVVVKMPTELVKEPKVIKQHRDSTAVRVNVFFRLFKRTKFAEMDRHMIVNAESHNREPPLHQRSDVNTFVRVARR